MNVVEGTEMKTWPKTFRKMSELPEHDDARDSRFHRTKLRFLSFLLSFGLQLEDGGNAAAEALFWQQNMGLFSHKFERERLMVEAKFGERKKV
ncbi:hypothetical protein LguiA_002064 [Lonicera macranthoides]